MVTFTSTCHALPNVHTRIPALPKIWPENIYTPMLTDVQWTALTHMFKFLIIKPIRCTNFSNLFLEWNSTCLGQFLCPSLGVFHCTHSNGICHTGLLTACEQAQAVSKPVWHIPLLCVQWKTPDDGHRNCPRQVEFHSKKKFEKLMHLIGFIIRNLARCTVTWTSNTVYLSSYTFLGQTRSVSRYLAMLISHNYFLLWNVYKLL